MPHELESPAAFLRRMLGVNLPDEPTLRDYQSWWAHEGDAASSQQQVEHGLKAGVVWRADEHETPIPAFLLLYVTAFYAPDVSTVHAASLAAMNLVDKYAPDDVRARFFPRMVTTASPAITAAVWLGDPDGADVSAYPDEGGWRLLGERDGCDNAEAGAALVAARPEGAPHLALFLVPRQNDDGSAGYRISRLDHTGGLARASVAFDDSRAYLLGEIDDGADIIREADTTLMLCDTLAGVAVAQRLLARAAGHDAAQRQIEGLVGLLRAAFALAWACADLCNATWREIPGARSETYRLFLFVARIAHLPLALLIVALAQTDPARDPLRDFDTLWRLVEAWTTSGERPLAGTLALLADAYPAFFARIADDADTERLAALRTGVEAVLQQPALSYDEAHGLLRDLSLLAAQAAETKLARGIIP